MPQRILQHEAADPRAGVEDGENEQRFKHDGEVVPDGHQRFAAQRAREDMRHTQGKRGSAAGAIE